MCTFLFWMVHCWIWDRWVGGFFRLVYFLFPYHNLYCPEFIIGNIYEHIYILYNFWDHRDVAYSLNSVRTTKASLSCIDSSVFGADLAPQGAMAPRIMCLITNMYTSWILWLFDNYQRSEHVYHIRTICFIIYSKMRLAFVYGIQQ